METQLPINLKYGDISIDLSPSDISLEGRFITEQEWDYRRMSEKDSGRLYVTDSGFEFVGEWVRVTIERGEPNG